MHQLVMHSVERLLGRRILLPRIGGIESSCQRRFLLLGQVVEYVPALMYLTALDPCRGTGELLDGWLQSLRAVEPIESWRREIESVLQQIA